MKKKIVSSLLILATMGTAVTACNIESPYGETVDASQTVTTENAASETVPSETELSISTGYEGLSAEEICGMLTLEEKVAQLVQGANYEMTYDEMRQNCYGSVLSHIPDWPALTVEEWQLVTTDYQNAALLSDTAIPYIYANDCVHGVNEASGSVIFPHNINIGAAGDTDLAYEVGVLTGSDMLHCGFLWSFSPCVASAQDPRWGRTYESYSSDEALVQEMAVAYTTGLMSQGIIACPKHFIGDGYAQFGTGEDGMYIDRGDATFTDEERAACLAVYQALIDAGVQSIMLSHSSLDGVKMHENADMIDYLRNEMGFEGVIISDWESVYNCSAPNAKDNIILCFNAGVDMFMEEDGTEYIMECLIEGVNENRIPMERIDDAVTRILQMKMDCGIFDDPYMENMTPSYDWNSEYAHEVARQLAAESMVPLKLPETGAITLEAGMKVYVSGPAADDVGALCGGWTYLWQGASDADMDGERFCSEGPSILGALQAAADEIGFEIVTDSAEMANCDAMILCVGEIPYAEWVGDTEDLSITGSWGMYRNTAAIDRIAEFRAENGTDIPVITLIVAGRNVIIEDYINDWDEVIMCYLPGSEGGNAVADILTGAVDFHGTLPMPYYSSVDQIGTDECWLDIGYSAADEV